MLAIRMQRTGRSGHAQFRMIVQDSRFHPSSGRVVAYLGNYNPHTKESSFDKDKLQSYLVNGAQPSPRVVKLLKKEKIKLPEWVNEPAPKKKTTKNPDKRRSTRPEGAPEPEVKAPTEETPVAEEPTQAPAEAKATAEKSEEPAEPMAEETKTEVEAEKPPEEIPEPEVTETPPEPAEVTEKPAE